MVASDYRGLSWILQEVSDSLTLLIRHSVGMQDVMLDDSDPGRDAPTLRSHHKKMST